MKIYLSFLFSFFCTLLICQDTIYKRNGESISAKVLEINIKEISYKRTDLLDGPLFIINKTEIKKIKYATGAIDSFKVVMQVPAQTITSKMPIVIQEENNLILNSMREGVYLYKGNRISDRRVMFLATEKNYLVKNKDIDLNIESFKRNKTLQYVIGFGGAGLGGVTLYGTLVAASLTSNTNDILYTTMAGITGAGILVSSQIISRMYKKNV